MDTTKIRELIKQRDALNEKIAEEKAKLQAEMAELFGDEEAPTPRRSVKASGMQRVCSVCGKTGHNARTCPEKPKT